MNVIEFLVFFLVKERVYLYGLGGGEGLIWQFLKCGFGIFKVWTSLIFLRVDFCIDGVDVAILLSFEFDCGFSRCVYGRRVFRGLYFQLGERGFFEIVSDAVVIMLIVLNFNFRILFF